MDASTVLLLILALLPIIFHLLTKLGRRRRRPLLPPGSMGLPIIGHSLSFVRARRSNTAELWIDQRIHSYGPVSKLSLFGKPTVLLTGQLANKFLFTSDAIASHQPPSISRIVGGRNIFELVGADHRRVRSAMVHFLKPDVLKRYVAKMDGEVRHHLKTDWIGRQQVTVLPSIKRMTFDVICSLIFGVERGSIRESLLKDFTEISKGMLSVPINLPFTRFSRGLRAGRRAREVLKGIIREKKVELDRGRCSSDNDFISYLLSLGGEDGSNRFTEDEIADNSMILMIGGYGSTSVLITFIIRHLGKDPVTCDEVVKEQEAIARSKSLGEPLTWDDLSKMKYSWRVAMEILRMIPPVFGGFKRVLKDVEFGGYVIPKGWQVYWSSFITHMDADIFHDPSRFDPTRFESQKSHPPFCFLGFGAGPRICPGNEFARIEVLVAMHHLVTQFRWKLSCKDDSFRRDPMPCPSEGLPVWLEPMSDLLVSG